MKILSGNQLKIIALLAMTCDHVGVHLFPQYRLLRIIGRLAMPIFAYMIAEGCRYTKNRGRYLMTVAAFAALCQIVYFVAERSLYQCILVTFSLSICLIFAIDYAKEKKNTWTWALAAAIGLGIWFLSVMLPNLLRNITNYTIDYGIWGILLPVVIYFTPEPYKACATVLALLPLCLERGGIQWYCLAAVVLLMLYNGKRGKANLKICSTYIILPTLPGSTCCVLHFGDDKGRNFCREKHASEKSKEEHQKQ